MTAGVGATGRNMITKTAKKIGMGTILTTGAFCIFDFLDVPGAFKLKYNHEAKAVKGLNWGCGLRETGKSAAKCLTAGFAIPLALAGLTVMASNPISATVLAFGEIVGPMLGYSGLNKLLKPEKEIVEKACKEKGIDISKGITA